MAARYHVAMTDEGATSDLASTIPGDPHALSRTAAAAGPPVQAGDQLPVELPAAERYRDPELLGRGGMGIVQRFQDAVIGREVAMKVSVGASDPRFLREARIQAQLEHPSIVPVYDLGKAADGHPFFTMKRVRGRTLDELVPELPTRRLLAHFATVCLAVDFAHARGVVHRDLKPPNVMVGDFGEVYVLDWGIAKLYLEPGGTESSPEAVSPLATRAGDVVGTPLYMAPEQARGEPVSPATDVFALGAMLFEILCKEPLLVARSAPEALLAAQKPAEARPSVRRPDLEIAPELAAICMKATAFDRAERYASARELHDALERFLDGDRDLELRRRLARDHVDQAMAHAAAATTDAPDADERRVRALREVGRALALDPDGTQAMQTLVALLSTSPRKTPREVAEDVLRARLHLGRLGAQMWALGGAAILAMVPVAVLMGVREPWAFAVAIVTIVVAGACALRLSKQTRPAVPLAVLTIATSSLGLALTTRIVGPFVVTPVLAMGISAAASFHPITRRPVFGPAVALAAVFVPLLVDIVTGAPLPYRFDEGGLRVLPRMVDLPPAATWAYLAGTTVLAVVFFTAYFARARTELDAAQRDLLVQRWQLSRLLPNVSGKSAGDAHPAVRPSRRPEPLP
jgi:serine/threonine-protein kinase